jgi:hypothetical protein
LSIERRGVGNKRDVGTPAMRLARERARGRGWGVAGALLRRRRSCMATPVKPQAKKEAPSEDGAYDLGPKSKSKVVANGRGRRKRHSPVALSRGRRIRLRTGCRRAGPREEDTVRLTSTVTICTLTIWSTMQGLVCQPCVFRTQRSALLTDLRSKSERNIDGS